MHESQSSPAHKDLVRDFWSPEDRLVLIGFRGFAKSTRAEEMVALAAAAQMAFRCCLFIGPNEARAAEHLIAVSNELKMNDQLIAGFGGSQIAPEGADTQTYLELTGGRSIIAMGRGQDIRGLKKAQARPDLVIVDDFEDKENVLTPEGRRAMLRWFLRELRLACHPRARFRVLATIMHPECVPLQLVNIAKWPCRRYPVTYFDGAAQATWPQRFPLEWVERERLDYRRLGDAEGWELEMMCDETAAYQAGDFKPEYFRVDNRARVWEAVWIAVDPARTTGTAAATTGVVAFSWVGMELVVWEDRTGVYKPSEIIEIIFELNERYRPVAVAFEEDGLNLWATEQIRAEAAKRGIFLPVEPVRAPRDRDKFTFIRGLEPHFRAGEVVFAGEMPMLREQFLGFPRGRIDGPNALAYALILRPGLPVYDGFNVAQHVADSILWPAGEPLWLALGSDGAYVTGVLVGCAFGRIAVLYDFLREGDPGVVAADIVREALMRARQRVNIVAGPEHFQEWSNVGLCQAVRRIPADIRQGGNLDRGRDHLRRQLGLLVRDIPAFRVDSGARWTLSALAVGYAKKPGKPDPEPGIYRTLMESLESLLGLMALGNTDDTAPWSYTGDGRRYRRYATAFERVH